MINTLEQNTQEWKDWRVNSIGASESMLLMGSLPFRFDNLTNLWKRKIGLQPEKEYNAAMRLGSDNEDIARQSYMRVTGNNVVPVCFSHSCGYISASFDGYDVEKKISVEIKIPQPKAWEAAKKGKVKDYYYTQIQHHYLASEEDVELEFEHYWVHNEQEGGCLFKVFRNEAYIKELKVRCDRFWNEFILAKKCPVVADFGMDDRKICDPFKAGKMEYEFIGFYPNLANVDLDF